MEGNDIDDVDDDTDDDDEMGHPIEVVEEEEVEEYGDDDSMDHDDDGIHSVLWVVVLVHEKGLPMMMLPHIDIDDDPQE